MPVDINQACRVDQLPTRNWDHEMFNLLNLLYVKKCDLMHSVCYPPSNFVDVSDPGSVEERCQNDYFQWYIDPLPNSDKVTVGLCCSRQSEPVISIIFTDSRLRTRRARDLNHLYR